jgi:phosphotransferase system enzyme I (PtsI)
MRISRQQSVPVGERVLEGLGVAPGIAIGPAHVIEAGTVHVPEYRLAVDEVDGERRRFAEAIGRARGQIDQLKEKVAGLWIAASPSSA